MVFRVVLMWFLFGVATTATAQPSLEIIKHHPNAGVIVLDESGNTLYTQNADNSMVPASTTKLATAYMVLSRWGEDHRFHTDFFYDTNSQALWVKGYGDPYLTSEELARIALQLKNAGVDKVAALNLDGSYFAPGLILPGTSITSNPYDAVPTALAANFNTMEFRRVGGRVIAGEEQTPITPTAKRIAAKHSGSHIRVNTGPDGTLATQYLGELLNHFMLEAGIEVTDNISFVSSTPDAIELTYRHKNSLTVGQMTQAMLKYSNNFIANQMMLKLAAEKFGAPSNAEKVRQYTKNHLDSLITGYYRMVDGAGLSHSNRFTPTQLISLVKALKPWHHLMPEPRDAIYAKTGTLKGVSTLAGYFKHQGRSYPFAVMLKSGKLGHNFKFKVAQSIQTMLPSLNVAFRQR